SSLSRRLIALTGAPPAAVGAKDSRKTAAMINRDVLSWLGQRGGGERPFFAFINYYDAHAPFQTPDDFTHRYGLCNEPVAVRKALLRDFSRLAHGKTLPGSDAASVISKSSTLLRDSYDTCIAYLDSQLGRLVDDLEQRGLLANTLVIVTSDHGEHFGEHHL